MIKNIKLTQNNVTNITNAAIILFEVHSDVEVAFLRDSIFFFF